MSGSAERCVLWGRQLYERQTDPMGWAGLVLAAAADTGPTDPAVDAAIRLATDPARWSQGREVFEQVRSHGLRTAQRHRAAEARAD